MHDFCHPMISFFETNLYKINTSTNIIRVAVLTQIGSDVLWDLIWTHNCLLKVISRRLCMVKRLV